MSRRPKSRSELRHQRERVVATRLARIRDWFGGAWGLGRRGAGGLHKDHFTNCSCALCQPAKTRAQRAAEKRGLARLERSGEDAGS
jgi:hypothetical protein